MEFLSTNGTAPSHSFFEAMKQGLAPDGGLFMPKTLPVIEDEFWETISSLEFHEIAYAIASSFLTDELTERELRHVIDDAFDFPIKLIEPEPGFFVLELYHGPTLAFKDFGARFMARLFSIQKEKNAAPVTILAATSGDTGSAVAHGFFNVPGINVCLLYPRGKVSRLQEQQMTTLGGNITTIEIDGVFDDCQKLVKQAFTDPGLNSKIQLSSANSINIARLLPQSFYYAYASAVLRKRGYSPPVFSVPSGNFGNLTAGLFAHKMGMDVTHFIAATNSNDVVPRYLRGSEFYPTSSIQTISNAMDVGNPSNFVRIKHLFKGSDSQIRKTISGLSYSDAETIETIKTLFAEQNYLLCPHSAIGYRAAKEYASQIKSSAPFVTLATAHPVKFKDAIEPEIDQSIPVPARIKECMNRQKKSILLPTDFDTFKSYLLD